MKNRILILAMALALCVTVNIKAMATEKVHITVKAAEGVAPTELVISKEGVDPADSPYRTNLDNGIYEIDIETDFIEPYGIRDWTQLINNGMTDRFAHFLIEDGAEITLTLYEDRIEAHSTGPEQLAVERMESLKMDTFKAKAEEIEKIEDENEADEMYEKLMEEINQWESDYYIQNPMISFMLDLNTSLSRHRFNDHTLMQKLQLYHDHYSDKYPGHPAHQHIAENEKAGKQIYGGKYYNYDVRTIDGEKVRAYNYIKPGYNLVILWASWCAPCRKEAQEIAGFIDPYIEKGLNVFALTREFKNTDALKQAVEKDKYPWPTLVDLDDEFHVFDRHGATSSAIFLIDPEGKIVFSEIGTDKVKAILDTCLN
ncbi:MAG: TlpA family protein disulfide reductase [Muribaculaceae bacterium]|nr:TlpA family protein disulfide reductase [Muribaculaceae bacterium]